MLKGISVYKFIKEASVPFNIKKASLLMATYGFWILIWAIWFAFDTNFENSKELFRGIVRFAGMTYLAWWLLSLNKKSWWFAIGACGFFATMGFIGIISFIYLGVTTDRTYLLILLKLLVPTYLLSHVFAILINPKNRKLFSKH